MRSLVWRLCVLFTVAATPAAAFAQVRQAMPQTGVVARAESASPLAAESQTTAFTYQGRLNDASAAANGQYDLEFKLYDGGTGGTQQGSTVTLEDVQVTNGVFTVQLDFGAAVFSGADRFLEIGVRAGASTGAFTTLAPRQQLTSTPYAVRSVSAGAAETATTAANFSGSLSGDVTGTQSATVVSQVGGQSAGSVASAAAANAVSTSAGDSVVTAVNASSSSVTTAHVSGDVELAPSAQQTATTTNHLINLKLVGARNLGTPGQDALLSLSASGHYNDGNDYDSERFRVENDGGFVSIGTYNSGCCGNIPVEGSGTRFLWYPGKAAIRAGGIDGTQWDDANIGLYSTAFGENVRALGDNAIAVGKSTVAANTGTVALGEGITATGANSVALGYGASTSTSAGSPRLGTFVFSDRSTATTCPLYSFGSSVDSNCQFHPTVTNSFNVRAVNGSFFYTNTTLTTGFIFNSTTATLTLGNSKLSMNSDGSTTLTSNSGGSAGVTLSAGGGSWNSLSDRNAKANFAAVDTRAILRGVLGLPISTWNYKSQAASVRHIGPMAQDFFATFKVGDGDKTIATIDPDGVALAAIQGLNEELKDRDTRIDGLQQQVRRQQDQIDGLRKLVCLDHPEAAVCKESK
jgi:hypothetical protein